MNKRIKDEKIAFLKDLLVNVPEIKYLEEYISDKAPKLEKMLHGEIKISFHDLKEKHPDFNIRGDETGWSASIIKVPVMLATFQKILDKEFTLSDELEIDHKYTLESTDFISKMKTGKKISILNLIDYMITVSDNEATNMLADKIGLEYINNYMQKLGANKTMLGHLLAPNVPRITSEWNKDGSNLTTTNNMTKLLTHIYTENDLSKEKILSKKIMQYFLEESKLKYLSYLLPKDIIVANKIGSISDFVNGSDTHDVGVINNQYVLSIMCNKVDPIPKIEFNFQKESNKIKEEIQEEIKNMILKRKSIYENTIFPSEFISKISLLVYNSYNKVK